MASDAARATPASGDVVPTSRGKALTSVLVGFGAAAVGAGMIYFGWTFLGGALVFGGLVLGGYLGLPSLFSTKRLIIAADRLQEVKGQGEVVAQIPFRNIAELTYAEHEPPFVGINLLDARDPESFADPALGSQKDHHGFDFVLIDEFAAEPKALHAQIQARHEEFLRRHGQTV